MAKNNGRSNKRQSPDADLMRLSKDVERVIATVTSLRDSSVKIDANNLMLHEGWAKLHKINNDLFRAQVEVLQKLALLLLALVVCLGVFAFQDSIWSFIQWLGSYWIEFWNLSKKEKLTVFILPGVVSGFVLDLVIKGVRHGWRLLSQRLSGSER